MENKMRGVAKLADGVSFLFVAFYLFSVTRAGNTGDLLKELKSESGFLSYIFLGSGSLLILNMIASADRDLGNALYVLTLVYLWINLGSDIFKTFDVLINQFKPDKPDKPEGQW